MDKEEYEVKELRQLVSDFGYVLHEGVDAFDKEEYERLAGLINPAKSQLLLLLNLVESQEKANTMLVEQNEYLRNLLLFHGIQG